MINTSELFSTKIAESARQLSARLMYGTEEISGEIRSIQIANGACSEGNFTVGAVFSSYIEVVIDECEDILEDKELLLQIGVFVDDQTIEYIDIGYYTVTKPKSSVYSTTFTAVGRITSKLNKLFDVPEVLTLRNIAAAITTATGVAITFNGEVSDALLEKDITGLTCKEALSVIAGTFGGFATEDNSGNIVVSKYNTDSKVSVNGDRMTVLPEFNDYDYDLNGVKVIVSAAGETEDGSAIEEVAFTEGTPRLTLTNEFMTADLFESFVANTVGYTYRPGIVTLALGDPRLQPWDCLEVTDVKDNVYTVPCLNIVHTFDGGLSTTITAPGDSESESDTQTKGPLIQQVERLNSLLFTAQEAILKRLKADEILTDDITGATGSFTKYLTGVKILGDLIEANTLKANTLILQGEDGIYRRLNIDSLGQAVVDSDPKYNEKLDGSVLVAESVTASQIAANAITTNKLAANAVTADKIDVTDLFSQNITARGNFYLGQGGALVYDAKKDLLSMRASQITAATDDGLVLSDKAGNEAIALTTQGSAAKIDLLGGLGSIYAHEAGQLGISSKSIRIDSLTIEGDAYSRADVLAQATTSGALKPMLTLSCRTGTPGYVSGSGAFFEAAILKNAYITITDERILFSNGLTQCRLEEDDGFIIIGGLNVDASGSFDGEQRFFNTSYCPNITDTASGVGCAFKASRGLFNEALVDKLIMTGSTGKISFYKYTGTSDGSMTGLTEVGYINSSGNMSVSGLTVDGIPTIGNALYHSDGTRVAYVYVSSEDIYILAPFADGKFTIGSTDKRLNGVNANILRTYDTSTTSSGVNARVYSNRIYRYSSSSRRYKKDIAPVTDPDIAPEKLYEAEVVQFKYNDGYLIDEDPRNDKLMTGFIVEDLEKIYPIAIDYNDDGTPEMWNANIIIPSMLKLIQDLHKEVEELKRKVN